MKSSMINFKMIIKSIGFAFSGLLYVIKSQNNARFHFLATLVVLAASLWLELSPIEWCLILIAISIVWITECFNTSIEKLFDLVNPEINPLVKYGKDTGAAAVLVAAILSVCLGIIVLGPALVQKLSSIFG
jgi:diacylglycerol kinase (ATP)